MSASPLSAPDWFDNLWAKESQRLPFMFRNDSAKALARQLMETMVDAAGRQATTPEGIRTIFAMAKIAKILKGAEGVLNAPNPSPEDVAQAVERLVERVKARG